MPSSAILDVAIGIAFVYLFLSLICSVVNEGIATVLSLRAKNLVRGIDSLFSQSKIADGRRFVEAIYAHGLIRGLYKNPAKVDDTTVANAASAADPHTFEFSLHLPSVFTLVEEWSPNLPAYIPSPTFATALVDIVAPPDPSKARVLDDVRQGIDKLPPSPTRQALLSLVAATEKDVDEFQQKVEGWFNDSMDRAASWYKNRAQVTLLVLGAVVSVGLNVDTIKLAQTLWNNPVERQATVELAENYVATHKKPIQNGTDLKSQADEIATLGQQLPFPFGWQTWSPTGRFYWLEALAGWAITALALSLGAPFWFDTLNKFMQVRSSVRPKEKQKKDDD
ncbi:MAG: hypothetical protein WA655_24900 [Candidatus Korobacteraceae bacterium]